MKKHRILALLLAASLLLTLCSSCSSGSDAKSSYDRAEYNEDYSLETDDYEIGNSKSTSVGQAGEAPQSGEKIPDSYDDKIIRTANLVMDASDAQKCYDELAAFAKKNGGREISVRKSSDTYGSYDYITINAELKIAPDKLEELISLAEKTAKVTSSEITSDDVTREYYDIKLRLETKKEALKSYYKLLKEAETIDEALEVQRYITDLTAEIESMEGMLRYYDSKIELSTVNLTINQRVSLHEGVEDEFEWDSLSFSDFLILLKNGFLSVVNFLWSLLLWIIIAVVALSPILLIAAGVFFIVRAYRKKHPKKPKQTNNARYGVPMYYPVAPAVPVQTPAAETAAPAEKDGKDNSAK